MNPEKIAQRLAEYLQQAFPGIHRIALGNVRRMQAFFLAFRPRINFSHSLAASHTQPVIDELQDFYGLFVAR